MAITDEIPNQKHNIHSIYPNLDKKKVPRRVSDAMRKTVLQELALFCHRAPKVSLCPLAPMGSEFAGCA